MSRHAEIKDIEHRVRSSMSYHVWQERNIATACLNCDATACLNVHHVIELYHILLGLWKLYGDPDSVVAHAIAMHEDNACEAVTLCEKCHKKMHPGRRLTVNTDDVRIEEWTVMPRNLPAPLIHHATKASEHGLTLMSAQLLAAVGWYILNGHMESRIIEFRRSRVARLLGKKPTSSFNYRLTTSMKSLQELHILDGFHVTGPHVELHVCSSYLDDLHQLPWFIGMRDIRTSKMPVFALRRFLCLQSGRRNYKIGKDKLAKHLCLMTTTPKSIERCVSKACEETSWASVNFDGTFFCFRIKRRGAVPIWSLRSLVRDAIREGS